MRCADRDARDILDRAEPSISDIAETYGFGRMFMKAFIMACVAAIVIAVVGVVALNSVPDSAEKAFTSSTGVRLGS